ncbi:MAG TPA: cyanase [Polyangiaceae bacterium]|nr:cyanase [Polyangiaceae bacterium]
MNLAKVTQTILKAKAERGLSWAKLSEELGASDVWIASCIYGENSMLPAMAEKLCGLLDLDQSAGAFLTQFPTKGNSLGDRAIPTDPLMYRFYEILCVYGTSLKEVIQEKCGDGIMSAIDFTMSVEKVSDPKGDRVVVHMNGKFLPYRRF